MLPILWDQCRRRGVNRQRPLPPPLLPSPKNGAPLGVPRDPDGVLRIPFLISRQIKLRNQCNPTTWCSVTGKRSAMMMMVHKMVGTVRGMHVRWVLRHGRECRHRWRWNGVQHFQTVHMTHLEQISNMINVHKMSIYVMIMMSVNCH